MVAEPLQFNEVKLSESIHDPEKNSDVVVHDKTLAPVKHDEETLHRGLKSRQVSSLLCVK